MSGENVEKLFFRIGKDLLVQYAGVKSTQVLKFKQRNTRVFGKGSYDRHPI